MHSRIPPSIASLIAAFAAALALAAFSSRVLAQSVCPAGLESISSTDRPIATITGIPTSANCWNPNDANVGRAAGEAKLWLAQHAVKSANISCMNTQFAEKLQKFMEAVPGGPPTITSGYRSAAQQQAIIDSGSGATRVTTACGSYHVWGLAADFNNNTKQQTAWMRANAKAYGIRTIGAWDPNHFESGNGKYGQCGVCNSTGSGTIARATAPSQTVQTVQATKQDDVPPESVIQQYSIPAGFCLESTDPIMVVPCSSLGTPGQSISPPTGLLQGITSPANTAALSSTAPTPVTPIVSNAQYSSGPDISSILNQTEPATNTGEATETQSVTDLLNSLATPFISVVPTSTLTNSFGNTLGALFGIPSSTAGNQTPNSSIGTLPIPSQIIATISAPTDTQTFVVPQQTGFSKLAPPSTPPVNPSTDITPSTMQTNAPLQQVLAGVQSVIVSLIAYLQHF